MRVLDIDLDFFLHGACPLAEIGERPDLDGHVPWQTDQVRMYLEHNLGVSPGTKIPGRIFETHDQALCLWQERILTSQLLTPFEIVHVDTHSDLEIGRPGPGLVLNGALCQSFPYRTNISAHYAKGHLDEANYLLFTLAMRYCSKLINVRNTFSQKDMPSVLISSCGEDGKPVSLQLCTSFPEIFEAKNGKEPIIPYKEYMDPMQYFDSGDYELMSVAISPRYSPKEADVLLSVFEEYLDIV